MHFRRSPATRASSSCRTSVTPGNARNSLIGRQRRAGSATANSMTCCAPSPATSDRRRAERDQLAVIHDADAIAQRVRLVHVVRRNQDRAAGFAEPLEHAPQLPPRLRIESGRRLVEKQQIGRAGHRTRDRQSLLLAARQLDDPRLSRFGSSSTVASSSSTVGPSDRTNGTADSVSSTVSLSASCVSCSWIPRRARSHARSVCQRRPRTSTSPASGASSPSRISIDVVLPGAVRSEQAEAFAALHIEVEAVDGGHVAVALDDAATAHGKRLERHLSILLRLTTRDQMAE